MKFISPSLNQQGWTDSFDLNAISNGTSPVFSLHMEHPSGKEYAPYLEALAKKHGLKVRTLTEVVSILPTGKTKELPLFSVGVRDKGSGTPKKETKFNSEQHVPETLYIVWAAGEFQDPRVPLTESVEEGKEEKKSDNDNKEKGQRKATRDFPRTELCLHNSQVRSWAKLLGEDFLIIGGYESGVDAAVNLSRAGKRCKVLASTPCWSVKTTDPSAELAPYTVGRLRDVLAPVFSPKPQLLAPLRVVKVEKAKGDKKSSGFNVTVEWQAAEEESEAPSLRNLANQNDATEPQGKEGTTLVLHTPNPPVLCTRFAGNVAAIASHLFEFRENGDEEDHGDEESDTVDGFGVVRISPPTNSLSLNLKKQQKLIETKQRIDLTKNELRKINLAPLALLSFIPLACNAASLLNSLPLVENFYETGFYQALSLVFVSEIGDKTFFIAGLLSMKISRISSFIGSMGALISMTLISCGIGQIFHAVPSGFTLGLPLDDIAAVVAFLFFGTKTLKEALATKDNSGIEGEFSEAKESTSNFEESKDFGSQLLQIYTLVFAAEFGDRSFLSTIALSAAQNPFSVAGGAIVAHAAATTIAVLGGGLMKKYLSEKIIGIISGTLFLIFAVTTAIGIF